MRTLLLAAGAAAIILGAADRVLGSFGARHFLPEQKMQAALQAGDGCILVLGDSRMVAGLDERAAHEALRRRGADRCIADLAIGATDVSGAFLAARTYLAAGRVPSLVVVGKVEDSLLDPDITGPKAMVGNNALHLVWSTPGDVFAEVPGFPFASIAAFDEGLRFLASRATALGRYQSLVSVRVQRLQDALTGTGRGSENRFGALGDMARLEQEFRSHAAARLADAVARPGARSRWLDALLDAVEARRTRVVVVELPMPEAYRRQVSDRPEAAAYRQLFAAALSARGHGFVDLSRATWAEDVMFADALHLGPAGAARLSRDLVEQLAVTALQERPR